MYSNLDFKCVIGKRDNPFRNSFLQRFVCEHRDYHVHSPDLDRAAQRLHPDQQHEHADGLHPYSNSGHLLYVDYLAQVILRDQLHGQGFLHESGRIGFAHMGSHLAHLFHRRVHGPLREPKT